MSAGAKRRRAHASYGRTSGTQCLGKDRYATQAAADASMAKHSGFMRSYRCPVCKYLHLTSKPKREKT
ncbi:hypothetical protein FJV46_10585 [Arthrobacter agilis]|uniref:hypothetical protein n=1 Tax=Arthrobacter agilis TaxID=37921 RepID=UPI000B34F141|nr:hypothetical protein [Arthrobacter agilis]OUM44177.1 hypothetical protein B8W74_04695 [Arthrobacter agilis]PPB46552.1 hypothetical protein CI784_06990 [Arthrobacter agilis]TPV23791.1 hypothetical protein FJV46_10585 [Arthrobacter agilis]